MFLLAHRVYALLTWFSPTPPSCYAKLIMQSLILPGYIMLGSNVD